MGYPMKRSVVSLLVMAVLSWAAAAHGQEVRIEGRVIDMTGAPVVDAQVELVGMRLSAMTGSDGRFAIQEAHSRSRSAPLPRLASQPGSCSDVVLVGIDGAKISTAPTASDMLFRSRMAGQRRAAAGVVVASWKDEQGRTRVARLVNPGARVHAKIEQDVGDAGSVSLAAAARKTAAIDDTLRVSKAGYFPKQFAVDTLAVSVGDVRLFPLVSVEGAPNMALIPAKDSVFLMGDPLRMTVQYVRITFDFWIDTTEVTQKDYHELMSATYAGYSSPPWAGRNKGYGDDIPAYHMSWYDAALYCNARSKRYGLDTVYTYSRMTGTPGAGCDTLVDLGANMNVAGYRLPTDAEWEYAYRAGKTTRYPWGDSFDSLAADQHAWYNANAGRVGHPVASKLPNGFGLYDVGGNVWEWAHAHFPPYVANTRDNPLVDPCGLLSNVWKPKKGGGWSHDSLRLTFAYKAGYNAWDQKDYLGMRVVLPVHGE